MTPITMIPGKVRQRGLPRRSLWEGGSSTRKGAKGGFSLIEVVVALAVISIALLSMLTMMLNTTNLKEVGRQRTLAKQAAMAKLEELKAQDFDSIVPDYGTGGPQNTFEVEGLTGIDALNPVAQGVISIDNSNPDLLDLTIVVTWQGLGNQILVYEARSIYAR